MKKRMFAFATGTALVAALLLSFGCGQKSAQTSDQAAAVPNSGKVAKVSLQVDGMTCSACASGIKATLKSLDGVLEAKVDYEAGKAEVKYDPDKASVDRIVDTINKLGYKARSIS